MRTHLADDDPPTPGTAHRALHDDAAEGPVVSRRNALGRICGVAAGAALYGCTPLRIALRLYPQQFNRPDLAEPVLRALVVTVIPGAPPDAPHLARAYFDPALPFAPFASFLAADLCARAHEMFGAPRFDRLTPEQRTRVIEAGLAAGGTTRRLFTGAIFLAQVSYYAGIYDDDGGCPLIGFEGRYRLRPLAELAYPEPGTFLSHCATTNGNPA